MSASLGLVCALSPFICLPSCVSLSGGVRLSGSCLCLVSLHLSPFMCLPEWWCPPLRVLSVLCLPSCVSVSGGVRLSGSCLCLVSLHLSPFMCLPEWWCPLGRRKIWLAGSSLFPHVFPQTVYCRGSQFFLKRCPPLCYWPCPPLWVCRFVCLPSFVSLHVSFWVVVSGSLGLSLYLFSFHLSPFMCPSGCWCPALWVSRFICLPSVVSLHVSFWVVVSGFLGLSLYLSPFICLPSCVLLVGVVRLSVFLALFVSLQLSPLMCPSGWWCPALWVSRFICLPSFVSLHVFFWVVVFDSLGFLALFVSLHLSPFMCPSGWWSPAFWVSRFICLLSFVSLHVSFWVVVSGSLGLSLYLSPFMCPSGWWCPAFWVSRFICLPSCVLLGGGVRLSGFLALFVSLHVSFWVVVSGFLGFLLYLSLFICLPFMCPSGWWRPAL